MFLHVLWVMSSVLPRPTARESVPERSSQKQKERPGTGFGSGEEYGSVTKRPRRCGWLHLPDLRRAAMINGFACWNITKLDVLDTEEVVPVGMTEKNGKAVLKEFQGWKTSTVGITSFEKLPKEAQELIEMIEKETALPVRYIGTGQKREEMIAR